MTASVTGSYTYANGEGVTFSVEVDDSFPSSLWEAKAVCVEAICDVTGIDADEVDLDVVLGDEEPPRPV